MEQIFLSIYTFFQKQRLTFWVLFVIVLGGLGYGASRIKIEEDITRFFPDDERVEKLNYVFQHSAFAERLVFMVSVKDSATSPEPDSLIAYTEELVANIDRKFPSYVASITSQVDDSKALGLIDVVQQNLPVFLEEGDYAKLDSLRQPGAVRSALETSYRQLISPSGMITKKIIVNDPLGFTYLVLQKLQHLQYDSNVELYDSYLLSKDHRHLMFFVQPVYKPNDTGKNLPFVQGLNRLIDSLAVHHPAMKASYFGATAVAAGNARQIQRDTILTVSLMLVLLAVFLIGFFRKKRVPFLILIPVAFGGLFSLCCVNLFQGHISILAIAAGSIILGIAVNYSLHFLAHLKHIQDVPLVIRDLVKPMTLGSATTVLAFFCLQFVNASVLRDVGLFAGFSLIGAALCSLVFLPQLIHPDLLKEQHHRVSWIGKFSFSALESKQWIVWTILLLTPVFFYFAQDVSFNTDLSQLNYMAPDLNEAQKRLETINQASLTSAYLVSQSDNLENALRKNERVTRTLDSLKMKNEVQKYSSVSAFLISDSLQQARIARWNRFWENGKADALLEQIRKEGHELKFSEQVYRNFGDLLTRRYTPAEASVFAPFRQAFFNDYIIERPEMTTVVTLANVAPEKKDAVYSLFDRKSSHAVDRQMLTNVFVEYVHADFNFIVTFTSVLVFFALLLLYGRIELTLITFVPMLITWIWILGIMALVGIEFNIVNVMVSTFIFGLGDDYSIFIMDGLQQEYTFARKNLPSIRTSIFLSALTTISGLGVLIFAQHPALRSIAGISIIGIVCVFIMSQTLEPFLFRWLISRRISRGYPPMTFLGMINSVFLYGFFTFGSLFLTAIGLILKLIPLARKKVDLAFHYLVASYTYTLVFLDSSLRIKMIGRTPATFASPKVIICNHSSFMDILVTVMLHPKIILLTNKWVWNSPVFGGVVRLAGYYPVMEGAEDSIEKLQQRVNDGYSVLVFPEGTRSEDGAIRRFHKGAFYMAEALKLPIQPVVIHGAGHTIPKGHFYLNPGPIILKFLPPIAPDDLSFGEGYSIRTKNISRYFKNEYYKLDLEQKTTERLARKVIGNYIFKGPVLEWYMRVKLKLEKNYEPFHRLVPARATILDLGCGYGFLPYMLSFLSEERQVTGVDYDEDKIAVANNCYSRNERIRFCAADITRFALDTYDIIIIADVLHYLTPEAQEQVLVKCFGALNPGGKLIVREGNSDLKERHKGTKLTEFFSVKLMKFNKSVNALHFLSGEKLTRLANRHGLSVTVTDDTKLTSNVIFVIAKNS